MDDADAWNACHIDDLWIFDKLILSKKLGYICGPVGVDVPKPDNYILRPISNICGMGKGAEFMWIDDITDHLPPGYFWCEIFKGRHLSVDYINGTQTLCVEGFRDNIQNLYKWSKWKQVNDVVPYPEILYTLNQKHKHINCELIGDNIIEVHLRPNPDFMNDEKVLYVVWEDQDTTPPEGMVFVDDPDYKRLGFFKPI